MKFAVAAVVAIILIAGCASQTGVSKEEFDALNAKVIELEGKPSSALDERPKTDTTNKGSRDINDALDLVKYYNMVTREINIAYNVSLVQNEILIAQYTVTADSSNADAIRRMCTVEIPRAALVMEKAEKLRDEIINNKELILKVEGPEFAESSIERRFKDANATFFSIKSIYNSGKVMCDPGVSIIDKRYEAIKIRNKNDASVKTSDIKVMISDKEVACIWDVPTVGYYKVATCSLPLNGKCVNGEPFKVVMSTGEEERGVC